MVKIRCSSSILAFVLQGACRQSWSGSGDCVLLDFKNMFFALADSSGRSPNFSRDLLWHASEAVEKAALYSENTACGSTGRERVRRGIEAVFEGVLEKFYGSGSSTLSGLLLSGGAESDEAILVHTGDSSIILLDQSDGKARPLSKSNFWLAGKTLKMFQVETVRLPRGCRVLMASDGLMELLDRQANGRGCFLESLASEECDDSIVNALYTDALKRPGYDDAGLLLLKPGSVEAYPKKLIMGGRIFPTAVTPAGEPPAGDYRLREECDVRLLAL